MRKIVIGGGASGLMASYAAAKSGHEVILLEKNEKLGKKIYITGKGRCNLTNDCAPDEFLQNVVRGGKFLTGAIYRFSPDDMMKFAEENRLPLKVERGARVFPVSDRASDVTKMLERACIGCGVEIRLHTEVLKINMEEGTVRGVTTADGEISADAVIVATGGLSYPSTGSTGDGYRFASEAGHTVIDRVPSLTGIEADGTLPAVGVTLKNVVLTAKRGGKVIFSQMGELLFTHYGISGPLALSLSALVNRIPAREIALTLDLKPALSEKMLDERLVRDLAARSKEQMKSVLRGLLPAGVVQIVLAAANIPAGKVANSLTREERKALLGALKSFPIAMRGLRGFNEAVVTSGGVSLAEIDPRTMQSKKVRGLYFCGEVLDVDAFTGGFNLQIAFSTGYAAGIGEY